MGRIFVTERKNIRNIAIIAHVDHGKTTLVDGLLKQSGIFRNNEQVEERIMDSHELERERGITILSKNTSVFYGDVKINIIDTPGHADFGGEVERILKMVDGVLLLVDASDGPMPQTRFVLGKALKLNLVPVVVINKIDRDGAQPEEVLDRVIDLFIELGADGDQIDFPVVYSAAKDGIALLEYTDEGTDLKPLLKTIVDRIPPPRGDEKGPFQMLISSIDYDEYTGRSAIGRISRGEAKTGQYVLVSSEKGLKGRHKITKIAVFEGLTKREQPRAGTGEIVCISGTGDINIGDTLCHEDFEDPIPFIHVEEPTVSMTFSVNDSPFAGTQGNFITSRHLRDRLLRELDRDVSLKVEETESPDAFIVLGRGELHLSILIETMRRQGYEFLVSKPTVVLKEEDGIILEPFEFLSMDVKEDYLGVVMEKLSSRKGELLNMHSFTDGYVKLEYNIPARGLIGYRSEFLTDTRGNGTLNHVFNGYNKYRGDMSLRRRGSIIASEDGESLTYGLYNAQERGVLFIGPGVRVYEGMVVGENSRGDDMVVNVCRKKHMTNIRAAGSDEALRLSPPREMSLEEALEFISDDELLDITPKSIRIRKRILNGVRRARARNIE